MADKLFTRMFRHKRQNEKKESIDHSLHLDDLNTSEEPKTPVYVEDDDFVDRNEEFINLDDDLVDVEDENDENEVENEVENDSDNVEGEEEDEDDNVEDANLAYALRNGFAIKIQASHRNKDNEIYGRLYVCRLYGKSVVVESSQNKRRREVLPKSECKVRMYVNYQKKKCHWEVTSLELVHNHGLVSPSKMNLVQRERHVNTATRSLIKTLYGSGVRNCQVMNVIGNIHGGNDKVGFNVQHVRNVLRDERKKRFEISDAQAGLDLLHRLNEESGSKYFIRTEVDEENRLKCLVWIDPRCIMAYQNFGDVMAFDTTYRTNRYAMPFVPFTGVNHHYQSVIFGFTLMRDEHASTFEWILRTWLEGVGNNLPLTIITDQDQAMESAIAVVLPNTTHLLCSWHISQKFPEKLAHYYSAFPEFKMDFNNYIYKSLTECVFEARWASFVEKYHLQDHKWLNGLYELKHKWIPAYTRNKFSAFQNSTSRSEGMNSFFDKYVSSATGLKEFIENAQKALARQFMREKEEDYVTINLKRPMKLHTILEYHASCIYTKEMFRRFQDELVESSKYFVEKDRRASEEWEGMGDVYTYYSCYRPMSEPTRRNVYFVAFEKASSLGMCTCRMLEHSGLPCRHLLVVFTKKRVSEIPPYYINRRWTMHANRVDDVLPYNLDVGQSHEMTSTDRFNSMTMLTMSFCQSSIASKEWYDYVIGVMNREIPILERMSVNGIKSYESNSQAPNASAHEETILDPIMSQTKGRKKDVRFKSPIESIGKKEKPPRRCTYCQMEGHDKRKCASRLEDLKNVQESQYN
ncbi:protein FAR1-RELATED SEQUENCE 5-like [Apium graveolens]|uniref:protein FAR1-RELATED SEQUENCE 5-like n=1 Tax=Apium graveolens TaxID=4045 RepID=UPI003D78BEE0